jgi:hypothetical protein
MQVCWTRIWNARTSYLVGALGENGYSISSGILSETVSLHLSWYAGETLHLAEAVTPTVGRGLRSTL